MKSNFTKLAARVMLYGVLVGAVALLLLHYTGRQPDQNFGPVNIAHYATGLGPVRGVTPHPSPTHPQFVAPKPFTRPYAAATIVQLERLAKGGNAGARCELGIHYENGTGVIKDLREAHALYLLAARQNNGCGLNGLGGEAYEGQDFAEAARRFRAAASLGYPAGFYNLGIIAKFGPSQDDFEAFRWFKEAAQRGYTLAYDLVGNGIIDGYGGAGNTDPWLAEQWYLLGAKAGDEWAKKDLAWYYLNLSNEPDHYQKAMQWFRAVPCACSDYGIGEMYANGWGVHKDIAEAGRLYKRAADNGFAAAQAAYGDLLRLGRIGAAPDPATALVYYRKAAIQGNGDAMFGIAYMTEHGIAVKRNPESAEAMYAAAAAHCSGDALFRLAQLYAAGTAHLPKDPNLALALAQLSLECGADKPAVLKFFASFAGVRNIDGLKTNHYYRHYKELIHDYSGDLAAPNPLPPPVSNRTTTI